jgi:hypothetical protein
VQPRYRRLIDAKQGGDSALRIASSEPLERFGLLMRGKGSAAAELHATGLGLDPTGSGAFGNTMALIAGCDPQHSDYDLGELRGGIYHRLRDRAEACASLSHCMEDVQQVTGVAGETIGGGDHQHVASIERGDRALELRPFGRRGR